jgi:hypothetical protein
MSFGFSIGDFITVATIIADIISSLQEAGGSKFEYQELVRELESLQHALRHLDKLQPSSSTIVAIQNTALNCQGPLEEFLAEIKRSDKSLGVWGILGPVAGKVRWSFGQKDVIRNLQSYLNIHVGTIDILLAEHGLEMMDLASDRAEAGQLQIRERLGPVQVESTEDSDSDFSVASLESFTASTIPSSATSISDMAPIVRDSATEVANLISKDQQLRELLDKAFDLLHPQKVTRKVRRALRFFSQDLLLEAETLPQEQVAKFVGQRSRHISVLLREQLHPSDPLELPSHNVDTVREERLQSFLTGFQPVFTQDGLDLLTEKEPVDEESEQDEQDDPDNRPDLAKLREWFLVTNAMQSLRDRFRLFLYPEKATAIEDSGIKTTMDNRETSKVPDKVQVLLEQEKHEILLEDKNKTSDDGSLTEPPSNQIPTENFNVNSPSVLSKLWGYINVRKPLGPGYVRLEWTCVSTVSKILNLFYYQVRTNPLQLCGHTSHDDFRELRPGAVAAYAEKLRKSGYVTQAQPTTTESGTTRKFLTAAKNKVTAVGRNMSTLKSNNNGQNVKPKARKFATIQCLPTPDATCRWLHLCLKKRPNAKVTKLEPLHVCKDEEEKYLKDAGLFKLLHKAWKTQRTRIDLILFKLTRIEFIKVRDYTRVTKALLIKLN